MFSVRVSAARVWSELSSVEAALVALVNVWAVIASLLSQVGMPVKVVSVAGAALALIAYCIKQALTAQTAGLAGVLVAVQLSWSVAASLLTQVGTPVKIVASAGALVALAALVIQRAQQALTAAKPT